MVGPTARILFEVDEAQDVEVEKYEREFRPMAATNGATAVYYGTPWNESRCSSSGERTGNWSGATASGGTSAPTGLPLPREPRLRRYVQGERDRLGEDHPLFRTQYGLQDDLRRRAAFARPAVAAQGATTTASPSAGRSIRGRAGPGRAGVGRRKPEDRKTENVTRLF